jgi:uncharacterized protein
MSGTRLAVEIGMWSDAERCGCDRSNGLAGAEVLPEVNFGISRKPTMKPFLSPLLRSGGSSLALMNTRHNGIVARTLRTAFDSKSRRKGLLGQDSMPEGSALIIAPSQAIHTFSMRFAIDVAFVSGDGVVLKVRRAVPPRRIAVALRAFAVIELPAGALERSDTKSGDRLRIEGIRTADNRPG